MRSSLICRPSALLLALTAAAGLALPLAAQQSGVQFVSAEPAAGITARHGAAIEVPLKLVVRGGHHIQSNMPAEEYLIPSALTWDSNPALASRGVAYPKAESVKYDFSEKPLSVFSGAITLTSRFAVAPDAQRGLVNLTGKFRYQACNDKMCFPPKTLPVIVTLTIE